MTHVVLKAVVCQLLLLVQFLWVHVVSARHAGRVGSGGNGSGGDDLALEGAAAASAPGPEPAAPWIAEASLHLPAGEGMIITPGLVAVRWQGLTTLTLAARAQWLF